MQEQAPVQKVGKEEDGHLEQIHKFVFNIAHGLSVCRPKSVHSICQGLVPTWRSRHRSEETRSQCPAQTCSSNLPARTNVENPMNRRKETPAQSTFSRRRHRHALLHQNAKDVNSSTLFAFNKTVPLKLTTLIHTKLNPRKASNRTYQNKRR